MIDYLFLFGEVPSNAESGVYTSYLVALSYIIASLGSFIGLRLATDIHQANTRQMKNILHIGGAFAFGAGIWSMHFIGMLAYDMDMAITYDPFLTGLSMMIAVVVAYGVLNIVRSGKLNIPMLGLGAVMLGVAICGMHYIGMAAMEMDGDLRYLPGLFALSVVIAVAASAVALWIVFMLGQGEGKRKLMWQFIAALIMGAAICGMHYTGVEAAVFIPWADCRYDPDQSFEGMALAIAAVTSMIFGLALAVTLFNKEKNANGQDAFPAALLSSVLFLTFLTAVWVAGENFYFYRTLRTHVNEHSDVSRLSNEVMRLDGILTEAARMAAATGDLKWEKRYSDHVGKLDKILSQLEDQHHTEESEQHSAYLGTTEEANQNLVEMEEQVFALAREGRLREAWGVMDSTDYYENKQRYAKGMDEFLQNAIGMADKSTRTLLKSLYYSLFFSIISIVALAVVWVFVLKRIGFWRKELIKTRNSLDKEKSYLDAIMDNMMQGVITINDQGIIQTFNSWAEATFGYEASEVIGKNVKILMPSPYSEEHDQYLQNYKQTGAAKIIGKGREVEGQHKKGHVFPLDLRITEIYNQKKTVFVGLIQDITERKEKESLLRHAKRAAEQANKAKSEFLANMSHELRTPLNSILGMTRMILEDSKLDTDNKSMADTVYKSATTLLEIVNDILDISKIEAGSIVLEQTGFDLKNTIESVMETMAPVASAKGVTIKYHYEHEVLPYLIGDSFRISRILTNLISNAVKYTDKGDGIVEVINQNPLPMEDDEAKTRSIEAGSVGVMVHSNWLENGKIEIQCTVKDTGIGIPEDKQEVIFKKFTQADDSISRRYGGTGLGLAITKELVELMGGTIGVESEVGKGSSFWFKITFDVTDQLDQKEDEKIRKERRKRKREEDEELLPVSSTHLLVAEDHMLNQEFILRLLRRMGFEHIDIVDNGVLAFESYKKGRYDLILMDCHMPERNGYDASRDIRKFEKKRKRTPIVALTADAMQGTEDKCLSAGMDEYITKPIDADELRDVLGQWVLFADDKTEVAPKEDKLVVAPVNMSILEEYAETPEDIKQFVSVFLGQSDEGMDILKAHCIDGACKTWVEAAHKFKGGAGMVGAKALHKLCEQAQGMSEASAAEREEILKAIENEYKAVKKYLNDVTK